MLHAQGHGDCVRINVGPAGDFQAQGLEDLGDDQNGPDLLEDDDGLGLPPQVELEVGLDQIDRQLNPGGEGAQRRQLADQRIQGGFIERQDVGRPG